MVVITLPPLFRGSRTPYRLCGKEYKIKVVIRIL
jgi:hypothetical protein